MRFVSIRELRLKPGEIWERAKEEELVLTSNGRPVAILTGVDEESFEDELDAIRRARALRALDMIHRESVQRGTDKMSPEEIQSEIRKVRKGRKA